MNFQPQKFFVGVVDFFSVLMPGALLSYALRDLRCVLLGPDTLAEAQGWLAFFFSSYLLGHFIFLIGSWLDEDYDKWFRAWKITVLNGKGKGTASSLVFDTRHFGALAWADTIRSAQLGETPDLSPTNTSINTYQWAKLQLGFERPEALAVVQRFEADSKFFRSFFVVLYSLLIVSFFVRPIEIICLITVLMGLAL